MTTPSLCGRLLRRAAERRWYLEVLIGSEPVNTPSWLRLGATVFDTARRQWGEVVDLGFPREKRQLSRAWLRPPGGGREWNPQIADLSPTDYDHPRDGGPE
ncbi:hypothetical protein QIS99_28730 [Streptomyces sp. B-S-A8]|uniref:Uncharacterized protein n=1 Tax=Streptomyces solicavernae TaxID=3043614 RepID=A0ABT6S2J3_9ACTN|nr:hypothetical protein [Streptomyces sp. B-S-A8]MDI3390146.1 hypothetical protein [Streptomyces sp. B-S-A8]